MKGIDVKVHLRARLDGDLHPELKAKKVDQPREVKARVDISTDVETYQSSSARHDTSKIATSTGGPIKGGVLAFQLQQLGNKTALPTASDKLEDLARFVGHDVTVTYYDKDDYSSLLEANKRGDSITSEGKFTGIKDGAFTFETARGEVQVDPEFYAVAEVDVSRAPWSSKGKVSTLSEINGVLCRGAEVSAFVLGKGEVRGVFQGVEQDARKRSHLHLEIGGVETSFPASDVSHVETPGYGFRAFNARD